MGSCFCYNERMDNSKLVRKSARVRTETIDSKVRRAVANITLEGVRPSATSIALARQVASGKLTGDEAVLMLSKQRTRHS